MANLLAKLPNPILMHILNYIGKEDGSCFFRPYLKSLINMFCVCKEWYARFDPYDLNLWELAALDFYVNVDNIHHFDRKLFILRMK
mmetsp:Transcript_10144/g.15169  ORF Transcript_10144/g.15169 Transcript_10144/m.15169 type:complete len:86 (-) Transcript_10144:308-565(-)